MLQFQPISLDVHLVLRRQSQSIIMATLWNTAGHYIFMAALPCRCGHYIFILWFLLSFYLLSFCLACQPLQIGCLPYFHTWCSLSVNLGCRCETCCTQLAENTGCKKSPKIRHLRTIAQLCRAISSQLRHVTTIGKKIVKQQYLAHMSLQYGELQPASGWDCFIRLGHPSYFQWVSRLGSVRAWHSSSGHQPNFAVLNTGRHLYLAGHHVWHWPKF